MNAFHRTAALSTATLVITALALSACGSSDGTTASTAAGSTPTGVLVDANGDALYSPSQEANGMIECTGSCEQIWKPVTPDDAPASGNVTGKLGTVKRPDGSEQVTLDGAPLYTFAYDMIPGDVKGDGQQDTFDGTSFSWHAATPSGPAADRSGSNSNGDSGNSNNGGYGDY
jgi:predicted lipoprotein with Yx(FWY)xxD motif